MFSKTNNLDARYQIKLLKTETEKVLQGKIFNENNTTKFNSIVS